MKQNTQPAYRRKIRLKLKELLSANVDVQRIFMSRPNKAFLKEVPLGLIYFTDDTAKHEERKPREYIRTLLVSIQFLIRWENNEQVDDWLDSREFEVINAIEVDRFLGLDFVEDSWLVGSNPSTITDEGNENIEAITINYAIEYRDCLNSLVPENDIGEFKKANIKYQSTDEDIDDKVDLADDNLIIR